MRIVLQGAATPAQVGKAISEILATTLEKAGVKGKQYPLQNTVVEFTLNLKGYDDPQLIMDEEKNVMLSVHTGIHKGEFVEYVAPDRQELVDKFDRMLNNAEAAANEAAAE